MKNKVTASNLSKSKALVVFELFLFVLCLSLIALRTTLTEAPASQSVDQMTGHSSALYSLTISAVLIVAFVIWLIWNFCGRCFLYRFTRIEIGLLLLIIASIIAASAASNTRAAITSIIVFIAPVLMAVLLVQILDSTTKIKLTLAVIAALGFMCTYQSSEQFYDTNEKLIKEYEQNPNQMLQSLNIQPGSLRHFQFEHRLYSKDIKAFFTTGNSAGSFAILALFAAAVLFIDKIKNRKKPEADPWYYITAGAVLVIVIIGLLLTHSKGAILATIFTTALFAVLCSFGSWLNAHKKTILIIFLLVLAVVTYTVISYGLSHNRLPGGKSMLVRWQYWLAAGKTFADKPYTGVGPGNFGAAYLHYKLPEAIETVSDPHNFPLSLLTQYGPLGLAAFLVIVFIPLWKINLTAGETAELLKSETGSNPKKLLIISIPLVLLFFRPLFMPFSPNVSTRELAAGTLVIFIMPVIAFVIGLLLITNGPVNYKPKQQQNNHIRDAKHKKTNVAVAALFCAVAGLLIHNLIDFAIFEPPVFTAFCAILACLIALDLNAKQQAYWRLKTPALIKIITALGGLIIIIAFFYYGFVPVARSCSKILSAKKAAAIGRFQLAHNLFDAAAKNDPLSPNAALLNGDCYVQNYFSRPRPMPDLLMQAEKNYLIATKKDPDKYIYFEKLSGVYILFSDLAGELQKKNYLAKAFDSINRSVELYPGSGRLHLSLAEIAEQLAKRDIALGHYKKAVEIEDAFRTHFRQIYPGREVFSRIGQKRYELAKEKIEKLSK